MAARPPEPATYLRPLNALRGADRTPGIALHLSPLADLLLPTIGGVLGPLAAWLVYRDRSPELDVQGREVLNFRLSVWLYGVIIGVVAFVLFSLGVIGGAVGSATGTQQLGALAFLGTFTSFFLLLLPVMVVLSIVPFIFMIIGVVRASSGQAYHYPLTIRFVR